MGQISSCALVPDDFVWTHQHSLLCYTTVPPPGGAAPAGWCVCLGSLVRWSRVKAWWDYVDLQEGREFHSVRGRRSDVHSPVLPHLHPLSPLLQLHTRSLVLQIKHNFQVRWYLNILHFFFTILISLPVSPSLLDWSPSVMPVLKQCNPCSCYRTSDNMW